VKRFRFWLAGCAAAVIFLLGFLTGRNTVGERVLVEALPAAACVQTQPLLSEPAAAEESHWVGGKLDLNRAGVSELEQLPGIGAVLAGRILEYRSECGGFQKIEQLMDVKGIGEKIFGGLRDQVTVFSGENGS
jgi:competence ComEA-like helix-hairpin-helix protein